MSRLVYRPPAQHGSATQFASWLRAGWRAVRVQERLIQRRQPRDNSIGYGEEPF